MNDSDYVPSCSLQDTNHASPIIRHPGLDMRGAGHTPYSPETITAEWRGMSVSSPAFAEQTRNG